MSEIEEKWIKHCCHKEQSLKEVYSNTKFECKVCNEEGEGTRYKCNPCNVSIHVACGTLPESMSSSVHPAHPLSLRPKPYLTHKCRVCRGIVTAMVYRCEAKGCKCFLHPQCSLLPKMLENHPKHPPHPLRLYHSDGSKKSCDVCQKKCKEWRYYCKVCDVHIHPQCLNKSTESESNGKKPVGGKMWTYIGRVADVMQIAGGLGSGASSSTS